MEKAYFAGGCFWCTEAVFKMLRGVSEVTSGYTGGTMENPSYDQVSSSITEHAEAIEIVFDPKKIKYEDLLYVFFQTHDPTTKNRQGMDAGTQYRSAIYYVNLKQKSAALKALKIAQKSYDRPIVTQIEAFDKFYKAEDYHQDYYELNPEKAYCKLVIDPKIDKLKKNFGKYLKNNRIIN